MSRLERGWAAPRPVMPARLAAVLGNTPARLLELDGQIDQRDLCLVQRLAEPAGATQALARALGTTTY